MADELHTPNHRWYEPRNHIALAKEDLSKQFIFNSGIQKIDAWINSQPWGGGFSPAILFAGGEVGVWYDPSPETTFTDTAGTTPATVGSAVALMLSKDKQQSFDARRNLLTRTEEFDDAVWSKNNLTVTADSSTAPDGTATADKIVESSATSVDHWIQRATAFGTAQHAFSLYAKADERSALILRLYRSQNNWETAVFDLSSGVVSQTASGAGTGFTGVSSAIEDAGNGWYRCSIIATTPGDTILAFHVANAASGLVFSTFGSITYTGDGTSGIFVWGAQLELGSTASEYQAVGASLPTSWEGNHATQATTAARPILARVPARGRANLLTRTEEFDNAVWVLTNAGVASAPLRTVNAAVTPSGVTACRLQYNLNGGTTSTDQSTFRQAVPGLATDIDFSFSFYVRSADATSTYIMIAFGKPALPQTVVVTGEWQRITVAGTGTNTNFTLMLRGAQSPVNSDTADILFGEPQLELGSTASAYQKVTSTFDVTEAGQADNYYLFHGGSADPRWMVTPTITPGTDKVQVFAGVRNLSNTVSIITELSPGSGNGVVAAYTSSSNNYGVISRGTLQSALSSPTGAAIPPITNVYTGLGDISGDLAAIRIDGAQVATSSADQGTGNFLAYPMYIGSRAGTSLYFNGHLYSLIARFGPNLDANTITQTEKFVASKTAGVSL
jgi:hypothetical protein